MRSPPQQTTGLIRQGWISLAAWIVFGLLIEGLIGFRSPVLLDDSTRRDMFRLAHAHGTLLNLVLIAAAICARLDLIRPSQVSSISLRCAVVLLPVGFLLGGVWHYRDDPGLGIFLVPIGAMLLLSAVFSLGLSVVRR
jgi:hypothetical protein